jgi:hypothetical protein
MDVETFANNPKGYYDTALPYLTRTETENTLIIGQASRLAAEDAAVPPESFFWIVRNRGEILGTAMWTPPHDPVLSYPFHGPALSALSESLLQMQLPLPGVLGSDHAAPPVRREVDDGGCQDRSMAARTHLPPGTG